MPPMAKSHPKRIETPISSSDLMERSVQSSSARISTTATAIDRRLSALICRAFVTAMTGAPARWTSSSGVSASTTSAASRSRAISRALESVSFDP